MARPPRTAIASRPLGVPDFFWADTRLVAAFEVLAMDRRRCRGEAVEPAFPTSIIPNEPLKRWRLSGRSCCRCGSAATLSGQQGEAGHGGAQVRALLASAEGARRRVRRP